MQKTKPPGDMLLRILQKTHQVIVGIDPGVLTGLAVWHPKTRELDVVATMTPYKAIKELEDLAQHPTLGAWAGPGQVLVRIEDARLRKVFSKADKQQEKYGAAVREGAGWAKAYSALFEDACRDLGMDYQLLAPARTKWTADYFQKVTGWASRTSNHARDAAALIYGL